MDDYIRNLERSVVMSPMDVPLRFRLYVARMRHGIVGPVRPVLLMPPMPDCIKGLRSVKRFGYACPDAADTTLGFVRDCADGLPSIVSPWTLTLSDFPEHTQRTVTTDELSQIFRWMVAVAGHDATFKAWRLNGVEPTPGTRMCLGLAFEAVSELARPEATELHRLQAEIVTLVRQDRIAAGEARLKAIISIPCPRPRCRAKAHMRCRIKSGAHPERECQAKTHASQALDDAKSLTSRHDEIEAFVANSHHHAIDVECRRCRQLCRPSSRRTGIRYNGSRRYELGEVQENGDILCQDCIPGAGTYDDPRMADEPCCFCGEPSGGGQGTVAATGGSDFMCHGCFMSQGATGS